MLDRLQLINFQKHDQLQVDTGSSITAITGPTDAGKSSVLRAIRWLATNRPRGGAFVKNGEDEAAVKIRVDGITIERRKGASINSYRIGKELFEAFGTDVPSQVSSTLRMDEINFVGQHDAPFWFRETAGEVAKQLNSIVDLGLIDQVATRLSNRLRKAKMESEVVSDRIGKLEAERQELDFVEGLDKDLHQVEMLGKEASDSTALHGDLTALCRDGTGYRETARKALRIEARGRELLDLGSEAIRARDGATKLGDLIPKVKDLTVKSSQTNLPDFGQLELLRTDAEVKMGLYEDLHLLATEIRDGQEAGKLSGERLVKAKEKLKQESAGLCPVCGQTWEGE